MRVGMVMSGFVDQMKDRGATGRMVLCLWGSEGRG